MISSPYLVSIAYLGIERKIVDGQDNLPSLNLHFRVVLKYALFIIKTVSWTVEKLQILMETIIYIRCVY